MSTFACFIWCSCPPNSERDLTDTQSRYANRKSYVTLNCRRAFQIWRITDIDKKESFTNVEIIPWSVLRYFMLRPLVFVIRSFLLTVIFFDCDRRDRKIYLRSLRSLWSRCFYMAMTGPTSYRVKRCWNLSGDILVYVFFFQRIRLLHFKRRKCRTSTNTQFYFNFKHFSHL